MSKHFFQKEQVNTKINGLNGTSVPFEVLPGNTGVIVLDDEVPEEKALVEGLNSIVGRMGVIRLNEEGYLAIKKKRLSATLAPKSSAFVPPIRVLQAQPPSKPKPPAQDASPAAPSVAEAVPDPVPSQSATPVEPASPGLPYVPRRGRPPKVKAPVSMPPKLVKPVRASMAPVHEEVVRLT